MNRIRWALGFPDPNLDAKLTPIEAYNARLNRQMKTRFGPTIRRYEDELWDQCTRLSPVIEWVWKVSLGRWLFIKTTTLLAKEEIMATRFVASHTSIPVPRVWMSFRWQWTHYIVMNRVDGIQLSDVWLTLSDDSKAIIAEQIRGYFSQLHNIPPPPEVGTRICSVAGGPIADFRLRFIDGETGPFRDEEHMNMRLRQCLSLSQFPDVVKAAHSRKHPRVFTHNDLTPRNIMVDPVTGKITALVDWGCAGWFPTHWEYCKAMNFCNDMTDDGKDFRKWISKMLPVYELESEADRTLMEMGLMMTFESLLEDAT
ncbi:hypothetical protein D9615_010179 [Tricholomella constricta]|uniref:Aminoglycoside phosphotransferase domain-containing protein n=1 Tax=Tricholomella constricta TaxID=117010 RepID=A0A8H5LTR7_9AGAR|nr:hypothetical protein D9615_010179 [Tricholomella constricta]